MPNPVVVHEPRAFTCLPGSKQVDCSCQQNWKETSSFRCMISRDRPNRLRKMHLWSGASGRYVYLTFVRSRGGAYTRRYLSYLCLCKNTGVHMSVVTRAHKRCVLCADVLGTVHHAFTFELEEGLDALEDVIRLIETYDVTTIRAAVPMYLLCRSETGECCRLRAEFMLCLLRLTFLWAPLNFSVGSEPSPHHASFP